MWTVISFSSCSLYALSRASNSSAIFVCLAIRFSKLLSSTVFFSKFLVESQDPDAGTAVLVDLADGAKYEVADAEIASTEGWSRGTLGVWLAEVTGRWLCVSIIPFHDFCRDAETDPAEFDYLTLIGRVLGAGGRYANSVRLYAAA